MTIWGPVVVGGVVGTAAALWASAALGAPAPVPNAYAKIGELARYIETRAQMPGFSDFARAVAHRESRGNNLAFNKADAAAACRLYDRAREAGQFAQNPHPRHKWCFSGGWFGFMPATALGAPGFENSDPMIVFSPAASVVLLADFVRRIKAKYFGKLAPKNRNWLSVRKAMASLKTMFDESESHARGKAVRKRFVSDLKSTGGSRHRSSQPVRIGSWPGATTLLSEIQKGATE